MAVIYLAKHLEMADDLNRQAGADIEITPAMIEAGVSALVLKCPTDVAFPVGGEAEAVEAVLLAALETRAQLDCPKA